MSGATVGEGVTALGEYGSLLCPMADCGEELYLIHEANVPLSFDTAVEHMQPEHAITTGWKVECCAGHVLLLPPSQHDESATFTADCDICNDPNELGGEVPHHNDVERLRSVLSAIHSRRDEETSALNASVAEWRSLAEYGFHLAQHGERAPGGDETWREFERRLRSLADATTEPTP